MQRDPAPERAFLAPLTLAPGRVLDFSRGELVDAQGHPVELRAQALQLLLVLGEHAGQVVGKDELLRRIWGDVVVTEDSLVQAVGDIRRALGDADRRIVRTVPRRGYLLMVDGHAAGAQSADAHGADAHGADARGADAHAADAHGADAHAADGHAADAHATDGHAAAAHAAHAHAGSAHTAGAHAADPHSADPHVTPTTARTRRLPWSALLAGALLLLALAPLAWITWPRGDAAMPRSLAILPFESEGGADEWFVDGVDGDFRAIVATWTSITVVGRGTMATYKGQRADPRAVGRDLGVRFVLSGSARRDGDRVRLTVSLVDAKSGLVTWSDMRDVPRAELAGLIGDVAGGLARTLVVELGDAVAADARRLAPHQIQADDLAMQAMAEFLRSVSQPAFERARQIFESSLRIDPECYRCVAGVSLTNSNLVMWEWAPDRQAAIARAEETLAHAALLNPDRLLTRLAQASLANIRRDWAGLLDAGDRLVEHFPAEPASHHHRCSALLRLGRFEESIDACARAARISPRDSRLATWQGLMGFNEFQRGRHAEAEQQLRASVRANPRVPFYGVVLAAAIAEQGRRDEAVQVLQETIARHPDYTRARIVNYWVATDSRFLAGRDRLVAVAGELGMP